MKKLHMILCAVIAFGAFSCSADDDTWTGFQDGQFETIGDDGEGDTPDTGTEEGDDDEDTPEEAEGAEGNDVTVG